MVVDRRSVDNCARDTLFAFDRICLDADFRYSVIETPRIHPSGDASCLVGLRHRHDLRPLALLQLQQPGLVGILRREPKANVERYDGLRAKIAGGRHAS
jgi:hypothetical protein